MAPVLKSCFEETINVNENNFNFGVSIYLKSRGRAPGGKMLATIIEK